MAISAENCRQLCENIKKISNKITIYNVEKHKMGFQNIYNYLCKLENPYQGVSENNSSTEILDCVTNNNFMMPLVNTILTTEDIDMCSLLIDIFLLITRIVSDSQKLKLVKFFTNPLNFMQAYKMLEKVDKKYFTKNFCYEELKQVHLKVLKILDFLLSKRPKFQFSELSNDDLQYCVCLIEKYQNCKNHSEILINLIRLLCRTKNYCKILGTERLFESLYEITFLTQQTDYVARIIRSMAKNKEVLEEMQKSLKFCLLIITLVHFHIKKTILKKDLITVLYKIGKNVPYVLSVPEIWKDLYKLFNSFHFSNERRLKMSIIKCYTLLSLGVKRTVMPTTFNYNWIENDQIASRLKNGNNPEYETTDEEDDDEELDTDINNNHSDYSDEEIVDTIIKEPFDVFEKHKTKNSHHSNCTFMSIFFDNNKKLNLKIFEDLISLRNIDSTKSVQQILFSLINKPKKMSYLAYPDFFEIEDTNFKSQYSNSCINSHQMTKLEEVISNLNTIGSNKHFTKFVYSKDNHVAFDEFMQNSFSQSYDNIRCNLLNHNEETDGREYGEKLQDNTLIFHSEYEGGNLSNAEQIEDFEYNLYLSEDTNWFKGYKQWFYFEISNMIRGTLYSFNIVNLEKINSQFNYGMQPVMFSTMDYCKNGKGWKRVGENIIYYGNHFTNESNCRKQYRTLSFQLTFDYNKDYCYIAYHYPYTYSRLMNLLYNMYVQSSLLNEVFLKIDHLCYTINKNSVPLVTITSGSPNGKISLENRPVIFITSRVHPSESNSSWIMEGLLKFLLEDNIFAVKARENYIFKIVPMLNPDGCITGNSRAGVAGCDLNRCWKTPDKQLHPEIYYTKKLVEYAKYVGNFKIKAFIDIHGHSRKKYYFFYGCNPLLSWNKTDLTKESSNYDEIPCAIKFDPNMKPSYCNYKIEKNKESTGRVVMWREFLIENSLTLECSYSAGDNKQKISTTMLKNIGGNLIKVLANLALEKDKK